jgi:DNA-binding NtrC family response regulator
MPREAVLIVDRERSIRFLAETVLNYAGYIVLAAETQQEAIETARANAKQISLILLDPNVVERRELLKHVRPGTPFVLSTDYGVSMATFAENLIKSGSSNDDNENADFYERVVHEIMEAAKRRRRSQPPRRAA